jgi:phage-related protein
MAGPEVGDIYLETHADTKGLAAEIRKAAAAAGKTFGREFSKGADQSMSGIGNQIRDNFGGDRLGRMTAQQFADNFTDDLRSRNWNFDIDLSKAIQSGDFGPLLDDMDDVNAQLERMRERITTLGKGGAFTKLGTDTATVQQQLSAYVDELNRAAEVSKDAEAAANELSDSQKSQAAALRDNQAAMKDWNADIAAGIKASERLARANEKAAGKEQAAQLRRNQAAMAAMNKEIAEGIKYSEQLARSANMTESTKQTNAYRDAVADTAKQLQAMQTQLNKMRSGKQFQGQEQAIAALSQRVREATEQFVQLQRVARDSTTGLDRGTAGFGKQMTENTVAVREFGASLKDLDTEIDVQANYPSTAEARARGAILGSTFGKAFQDATSARSGGGGDSIFDSLSSEWNQFLYAFPAEVTILARYIGLIGTEVATLGSAIGATLTAGVSSLGAAVGGLAAVAGATFPAMAYSIVLAAQAMKEFENSFPGTQAALDGLKDTFESVDVAGFAEEWSDSVTDFANTLSTVLQGAQLGATFGQAAAQVTAAFTAILNSPALQGFISAMQTTIPSALVGIGTGAAGLTSALLPVLTAAAPLAETLATRFSTWATGLADAANSASGLASISDFMTTAAVAIDGLIRLITNLGGALGNVFAIGADSGNRMLGTLAGLAEQFRAFTESAAGQSTIALWFSQGEQVMSAMLPLLGALGQMFGALVTPATVAQLVGFINGLTQLMPVLGQIMAAFGQLNFLGLIVDVLNAIGTAIAPVLPMVGQLAALISGTLGQALTAIQPALNAVGQALGDTLAQVLPVLTDMFTQLQPAFTAIGDAVSALAPSLVALFVAFNPVLRIVLLLLPALQPLIPVVVQIVEWISQLAVTFADVINPIVTTVAAFLGFSKATQPLTGGLDKIGAGFSNLAKSAGGFIEGIGKNMPKIASTIATVVQNVAASLGKIIPQIATAVQGIIPVLATTLSTVIPAIAEALTTAVPVLLQAAIDLFTTLVTAVTTVLPLVLQAILTALPQLITAIVGMVPVLLQAGIQLFTSLITALVTIVPMLLQTVLTLLPQLITTILGMVPMLITTALQLFMSIVQALLQAIPLIIQSLLTLLPQLITTLVGMIPTLITAGIQLFVSLVTAIVQAIPQILTALLGMLPRLISTLLGMIPQLITAGLRLFVSLVQAIAQALPQILRALLGILPSLLSTLIGMIPQLLRTAVQVFLALVTAIGQALPQILRALIGILPDLVSTLLGMIPQILSAALRVFQAIGDAVGDAWSTISSALSTLAGNIMDAIGDIDLYDVGRDIVQGLWNGLQSMWDSMTGWIGDAAGGLVSSVQGVLGIGSPSKEFYGIGTDTVQGLINGLYRLMPAAVGAAGAVARGVLDAGRVDGSALTGGGSRALAAELLGARGAQTSGRAPVMFAEGAIQVTPVTADPELTAAAVVDRMVLAMS